jgi:hypothetical protein
MHDEIHVQAINAEDPRHLHRIAASLDEGRGYLESLILS